MQIKEIEYDSFEYKKSIILRDKVLREPLGLYYTDDYLEQDKNQIILGSFDGREVVAVLLLQILNTSKIKMRQVAVKKDLQGQNIGSELIAHAENIAKDRDFKRIELNARIETIPFYQALGYHSISQEFEEIGIPHKQMFKNLIK